MQLESLQQAFAGGIMGAEEAGLLEAIDGRGLAPSQRLQIYRNNTFLTLTEALIATFPVVCRLVDERFFRYAAHEFIHRHPPASGDLHDFGALLPEFLESFSPCASLVYLPDVARLEWSWQTAYHAENRTPLAPQALAEVPASAYANLRLVLHPSAQLLASSWPVYRIWEANQPEASETGSIDLDSGGEHVLVIRPHMEVLLLHLNGAEHAFLTALQQEETLPQAFEAAVMTDDTFDMAAALQRHVTAGSFSHFTLGGPHDR